MPNVVLRREGDVARLHVDRAEKMNSLDRATLEELREAIADLARRPSPVVLVTSAGERVFVEPGISCGHCEFCVGGSPNLCPGCRFLGSSPTPGLFREYGVMPAHNAVPVPAGVSLLAVFDCTGELKRRAYDRTSQSCRHSREGHLGGAGHADHAR